MTLLSGLHSRVMSQELGDVTEPDLMEGLLFDLGIFGDYPAALGGPRSRSGAPVERTLSAGPTPHAVCDAPLPVSTGLSFSFGYDPNRQLTEKVAHDVSGESVVFILTLLGKKTCGVQKH